VLASTDPGAAETVPPIQHPQHHQTQDRGQGIAAALALPGIGQRAKLTKQTVGMTDECHRDPAPLPQLIAEREGITKLMN